MAAFVSAVTRTHTPHDGPLCARAISRFAASGVKLVGKFATTSTRYGSATSPAARLYSSIDLYWLRRYFWITLAVWSVRSASRCSMSRASVQICAVTSFSSKSARCMNAPKLSPRLTGSTMVNRTLPGGRPVRNRSIIDCSADTPAARPSSRQRSRTEQRSGNGRNAGTFPASAGGGASRSSVGTASVIADRFTLRSPKRTPAGTRVASGRWGVSASHGGKVASPSARSSVKVDATAAAASFHAPAIAPHAASRSAVAAVIFSANAASASFNSAPSRFSISSFRVRWRSSAPRVSVPRRRRCCSAVVANSASIRSISASYCFFCVSSRGA